MTPAELKTELTKHFPGIKTHICGITGETLYIECDIITGQQIDGFMHWFIPTLFKIGDNMNFTHYDRAFRSYKQVGE